MTKLMKLVSLHGMYNNYPSAKRRVLVGDTELQFVGFICGVCRHDSRAELGVFHDFQF